MTIGFLFWLFMVLWLVFGIWQTWWVSPAPTAGHPLYVHGSSVLLFILFLLLGVQVFGWPIRA